MTKKKGFFIGDGRITAGVILLVVFGSFMIASAEMGNSAGDTSYLTTIIIKQTAFALVGLLGYVLVSSYDWNRVHIRYYYGLYAFILFVLILCRFFGATNGAYAWIPIGSLMSIQPSEFAKAFMLIFAAKLFSRDKGEENLKNFRTFLICTIVYVGVILVWQKDLGSAMVLFIMCYCMALIPPYKQLGKYQRIMILLIFVAIGLIAFLLSPIFTYLIRNSSNYMMGRFLAAADPFKYRYDSGYHVVMSLVSFANGNWFGLGYTNSIHKYMNFPNPSNDFILPVIVEELGIFGFVIIIFGYALILYPIIRFSFKTERTSSKVVAIGIVAYFLCHFIFNVGGVSGFIPLTGVPLLILSSGGSSLIACLAALGIVQNEIKANIKE